MSDNQKLSKLLSLILRHKPETINISLDKNGWADTTELLNGLKREGFNVNPETLDEIITTNDKKRFCLSEDKTKIRANQGHSINIELGLEPKIPPDILYHGTAEKSCESIKKTGLDKRTRNHVHLSADLITAINVGKRHGTPIIFTVDAKSMHDDGYKFYLSANKVWLTDNVPAQYLNEAASVNSPTIKKDDNVL